MNMNRLSLGAAKPHRIGTAIGRMSDLEEDGEVGRPRRIQRPGAMKAYRIPDRSIPKETWLEMP